MWQYEKKLQYPVKIANPNPALAKVIISQLGGADFKKLYTKRGSQATSFCNYDFISSLILSYIFLKSEELFLSDNIYILINSLL